MKCVQVLLGKNVQARICCSLMRRMISLVRLIASEQIHEQEHQHDHLDRVALVNIVRKAGISRVGLFSGRSGGVVAFRTVYRSIGHIYVVEKDLQNRLL